jgi:hypothetical protein
MEDAEQRRSRRRLTQRRSSSKERASRSGRHRRSSIGDAPFPLARTSAHPTRPGEAPMTKGSAQRLEAGVARRPAELLRGVGGVHDRGMAGHLDPRDGGRGEWEAGHGARPRLTIAAGTGTAVKPSSRATSGPVSTPSPVMLYAPGGPAATMQSRNAWPTSSSWMNWTSSRGASTGSGSGMRPSRPPSRRPIGTRGPGSTCLAPSVCGPRTIGGRRT